MTADEAGRAMMNQTPVIFREGEYRLTGIITRYGRQKKNTTTTPAGWWYQAELTDTKSAVQAVIIASLEEVSIREEKP